MSGRVTYAGAATILDVHVSNVLRFIASGELTSSGKRGASLVRDEVEALAVRRAAEREARRVRPPSQAHAGRPSA